jgi:hypothetical protein
MKIESTDIAWRLPRMRTIQCVMIVLIAIAADVLCGNMAGSGSGTALAASAELLTMEESVSVTPDEEYPNGAFCRIFHRPSTGRLVVTFSSGLPENSYYAYKEYSADLRETGARGTFRKRFGGDYAAIMVDDDYFLLTGGPGGWDLEKYAPDWTLTASRRIMLDESVEKNNDMMLAFANGFLDASSLYHDRMIPGAHEGTHHRFYDTELEYQNRLVLEDSRHVNGSSLMYVNEQYHLFSSDGWFGNLKVLQYDSSWNYLGERLVTGGQGRWPQGSAFHDEKYYVAYVGERHGANDPGGIRIAILDSEWNLLDIVRAYDNPDHVTFADRPWLLIYDGTLYVSYDVATFTEPGRIENRDWSCRIKAYRISP